MVRERADRTGGLVPVPPPTSLTVAELRQLVSLMDKSDIEEITIEHEERRPTPDAAQARACSARSDGHVCHRRFAGDYDAADS